MSKKHPQRFLKPPAPPDPWRVRARDWAKVNLWTTITPYAVLYVMMGWEADASWAMWGASFIGAGLCAIVAVARDRPFLEVVLASIWFPSLLAHYRIFWKIGMPSPGGTAQWMARTVYRLEMGSGLAVAATLAPVAALVWALGWLVARPKKRR